MLKTFLAVAVLVFSLGVSDVHAIPDDGNRGTPSPVPAAGTNPNAAMFNNLPPAQTGGSGSLYDAVGVDADGNGPGKSASAETKCIAAGATLKECGLGGGPGSPSPGSPATSPAQAAAAQGAATAAAVKDYVNLHKMNGFDLGRLNSDREATLVISNSNAENNLVFRIIRLIGMLVGTVAILLYIVAGYFMIFSMGDENSLTKGKQIVTYTSLGLVIAFTAYMIVQLVMGLMYFAG